MSLTLLQWSAEQIEDLGVRHVEADEDVSEGRGDKVAINVSEIANRIQECCCYWKESRVKGQENWMAEIWTGTIHQIPTVRWKIWKRMIELQIKASFS